MEGENSRSRAAQAELSDDQTICVEQHGVEKGSERFPGRVRWPPDMATWRNNLTALSQHRNLYFVACNHQIHVYQPTLSGHTLGGSPAMILDPKLKNPNAAGYIWPPVPHAINSILVGDLGNEEILLLATDSGNVSAYRTERIFSIIEENKITSELTPTALGARVDCFFAEWVEQSAWGLAIHKLARIIAVSANTSHITVFAFALANDASGSAGSGHSQPDVHGQEWKHVHRRAQFRALRKLSWREKRARNVRLTFEGHRTNIPNISFLNCDLDPEGNWMFSTDIGNQLFIWNVWSDPTPLHRWNFRQDARLYSSDESDDFTASFENHRGWHVLALDPRDFRVKRSLNEACGGEPRIVSRGDNGKIVDLTSLAAHVKDSSQDYKDSETPRRVVDDGPPANEIFVPGSPVVVGSPASESIEAANEYDNAYSTAAAFDTEQDRATQFETTTNVLSTGVGAGPGPSDAGDTSNTSMLPSSFGNLPLAEYDSSDSPESVLSSNNLQSDGSESGDEHEVDPDLEDFETTYEDDPLDDGSDEYDSDQGGQWPFQLANFSLVPTQGDSALSPMSSDAGSGSQESEEAHGDEASLFENFPIIQFSETNIRLLQCPYEEPSVIFNHPVSQQFPFIMSNLHLVDRFNMVHYIPELGIVVAGSQKGRAGILTLTELPNVGRFFRLERIIPFASQERKRLRPLKSLIGIAVGPVDSHLARVVESRPMSKSDLAASTDKLNIDESQASEGVSPTSGSRKRKAASTDESYDSQKTNASQPHLSHETSENLRHQHWRGNEYSRRYRLLMMYSDHTILRYELYYKWPTDMVGPRAKAELEVN